MLSLTAVPAVPEFCFILMHNTIFGLVKMIGDTLFWLVSINEGVFLEKQVLNQNVFYDNLIGYSTFCL